MGLADKFRNVRNSQFSNTHSDPLGRLAQRSMFSILLSANPEDWKVSRTRTPSAIHSWLGFMGAAVDVFCQPMRQLQVLSHAPHNCRPKADKDLCEGCSKLNMLGHGTSPLLLGSVVLSSAQGLDWEQDLDMQPLWPQAICPLCLHMLKVCRI